MLKGKTALVTGSTSGIGLGIAEELAKNGCNIIINGFGPEDVINKIILDLEKFGVKASYSAANMLNKAEIAGMIDEAVFKYGRLDILVNNAGIQHVDSIENFPDEKWDMVIAINLSSSFHSIKHALPHMKKNNWGRIINIASAHGKVGSANKSAYVAAKHGIVGLTKVIGLETAEIDITCNAICPGWVHTPLVQKQIEEKAAQKNISIKQAEIDLLSEKQPSLKFVKSSDIGEMVVYLCSDGAAQVTGTEFSIDGGWTAR